jgi:hypothetical protein
MKKIILGILIICLIVGLPLIVMDALAGKNDFRIPSGYKKIVIDLNEKTRNNEIIFTSTNSNPILVDFYIQSDSEIINQLTIVSENNIVGTNSNEKSFNFGNIVQEAAVSSSILMTGKYTILLKNEKTKGKMIIGYKERKIENSEIDRLIKIDEGDIDNPPQDYQKIYSTDLLGEDCKDKTIYTLKLDKAQKIGLSIYTNSKKGNVSVDFIGNNINYYGLIYSSNSTICDQFELSLGEGEYEIKVTNENSDGQLYVFLKDE